MVVVHMDQARHMKEQLMRRPGPKMSWGVATQRSAWLGLDGRPQECLKRLKSQSRRHLQDMSTFVWSLAAATSDSVQALRRLRVQSCRQDQV